MTEVKKIKNIISSPSEEKIINNWKQVKSLKIKLLQESDWIFVGDSNLTESCLSSWIRWRDKVRKSKEIKDIEEATNYLKALQLNKPELQYAVEKPQTIDTYKKVLLKALQNSIKEVFSNIYEIHGNRDILIEKFEEALRFKEGSDNYILLSIESDMTHTPIEQVADATIKNRQDYLSKIIKVEKAKYRYMKLIDNVETFDQCDKILANILTMADKKWILI